MRVRIGIPPQGVGASRSAVIRMREFFGVTEAVLAQCRLREPVGAVALHCFRAAWPGSPWANRTGETMATYESIPVANLGNNHLNGEGHHGNGGLRPNGSLASVMAGRRGKLSAAQVAEIGAVPGGIGFR